jgi:hypothetical protein
MKYSDRGKINPFDSYMAGFAPWITPRQIIILDNLCEKYIDTLTGIEKEAFLDFSEQIKYEANIKRKRYLNQIV